MGTMDTMDRCVHAIDTVDTIGTMDRRMDTVDVMGTVDTMRAMGKCMGTTGTMGTMDTMDKRLPMACCFAGGKCTCTMDTDDMGDGAWLEKRRDNNLSTNVACLQTENKCAKHMRM